MMEVKFHSQSSQQQSRPTLEATSLQEAGAPYPPAKPTPELQIDGTLHSTEAPDQRIFNTIKD